MKYSTKVKIAVGIGFAFIIIMAIVMFVFVSNNSTSEEIQDEDNISAETTIVEEFTNEILLYDIASFGIKESDEGTYLYKISNDLEEEAFINLEQSDDLSFTNFVDYTYSDGKVYLLYQIDEVAQIYSIDLENYEKELVTEIELDEESVCGGLGYNKIICAYDDKIYFIIESSWKYEPTYIYEYDIANDSTEILIQTNEGTLYDWEFISNRITLDKENNMIYYITITYKDEQTNSHIYKLDIENKTKEEILNIAESEFGELIIKDNYLVCSVVKDETTSIDEMTSIYYIYNIEEETILELGENDNYYSYAYFSGNIAFTDDYIIFSDGEKILLSDYNGEINSEIQICEEDEEILEIANLTEDQIQVKLGEDTNIERVVIIDFNYDILEEVEESYSNVLTIK